MACSMSMRQVRTSRTPAAPSANKLPRRHVVRAVASAEVPPNVAEARAWIAAWRAKQQQPAAASSNGKPAAAAAPKPAAAKKAGKGAGKFGASASMADGTLVFTADQLQAVNYSDIKLKGSK